MILVPTNKVEKIKYFSTLLGLIFIEITRGPSVPDLSLILFADDTSAFTSHKDLSTLNNIMNNGLSKLNTWFKSNKLSLNLKKTNYCKSGYFRACNFSRFSDF